MLRLILKCTKVILSYGTTHKEDVWVDLDIKDVDIVLCKSFADLEDPSSIESAYTLNVLLPFTKLNVDVLGELYLLDYNLMQRISDYYFDAKLKHKFKLLYNEDVLYEGDFVLNNVTFNENILNNIFNVTLYDESYNVFKKLDYTIGEPAETSEFATEYAGIADSKYKNINALNCILTASEVANTWTCGCQYNTNFNIDGSTGKYIYQIKDTSSDFYKIGGFLPTYKKDDNFKYDTFAYLNSNDNKVDEGTITTFKEYSLILPEELYEINTNVWKTYNCKPYLYYKNYVEFIAAEIYRSTGYKVSLNLDANDILYDFFLLGNPYWANLIRTCKYIDIKDDWHKIGVKTNGSALPSYSYTTYLEDAYYIYGENEGNDSVGDTTFLHTNSPSNNVLSDLTIKVDPNDLILGNKYRLNISSNMNMLFYLRGSNIKLRINRYAMYSLWYRVKFYSNGILIKDTDEKGWDFASDDTHRNPTIKIEWRKRTLNFSGDWSRSYVSLEDLSGVDAGWYLLDTNTYNILKITGAMSQSEPSILNGLPKTYYNLQYVLDIDPLWIKTNNINRIVLEPTYSMNGKYDMFEPDDDVDNIRFMLHHTNIAIEEKLIGTINYNNLLGSDFNILNGFTDFLKIFNLICDVDYYNKKINVFNRGEYFNKYIKNGVYDASKGWADKIMDFSENINTKEDVEISELISDYKEIQYKYEDRDDYVNTDCRNVNGHNNHDIIKYLEYETNTDTYNYLEDKYNSCYTDLGDFLIYNFNKYLSGDGYCMQYYKPPVYVDVDISGDALDDVDDQLLFRNWNDLPITMFKDPISLNVRPPLICAPTVYEYNDEQFIHIFPVWNNVNNYSIIKSCLAYPDAGWYYHTRQSIGTSPGYIEKMQDIIATGSCYCSEWVDFPYSLTNGYANGIYDLYHYEWISFIYAKENRKVKATMYVPLDKYLLFSFDKLITIDNNLYMILSIDEYAFNNCIMKVTMIKICNDGNIDQIDHTFNMNSLLILPQYFLLSSSLQYYYLSFKVNTLEPATISNYLLPNWINGSIGMSIDGGITYDTSVNINAGLSDVVFRYTTNNNYPYILDSYYKSLKVEQDDSGNIDYVYITNIPNASTYSGYNMLNVSPTLVYVDNDTKQGFCQFDVSTYYRLSAVSLSNLPSIVINNFLYNISGPNAVYANIQTPRGNQRVFRYYEYTITCTYNDTVGLANLTQYIYFYNTGGAYASASFIRKEPEFVHETLITTYNGNTLIWVWDYTSYEELAENCVSSIYAFDIRTNYDFTINNWHKTLYDSIVVEYSYNDKCNAPILEDYTDPNNVITYTINKPFVGTANNVYKLRFIYNRKYLTNDPRYNGFIEIKCIEGTHPTDPYVYTLRVIANVLNDTP